MMNKLNISSVLNKFCTLEMKMRNERELKPYGYL